MKNGRLLSIMLCLASMAPSLVHAEPTTIRLGFIAASTRLFQSLPLQIAQQKGMLEKEGLRLEVVMLAGTDQMVAALDDGRVDITSTALPYLVNAVLKGSDAVAVVGGPANTISTLVARPEIKTYADLKGQMVGLSLPVDVITIGTRKLLAAQGLQDGDYKTKELVGTPARAKCLESEDCAAVPLVQPDDLLFRRKGYHLLGNTTEVLPVLQFTVFAARRSWASQHKDELVRFARAMGEADRFMGDPKNRADVIAMGAVATGADPDIVSQIYDLYYQPYRGVIPKQGEINVPGITVTIELMGASGQLKDPLPPAERFVDLQFLRAAGLQ